MSEGNLFTETEQSSDSLKELGKLVQEYRSIEKSIEELEKALTDQKKELEMVSRIQIPAILNATGLSEVRLESGEKVVVQDKLIASIANKNYTLAFRNMVNEEGGTDEAENLISELFKSQIILEDESEEILELLIENDITYEKKMSIHPQALGKYCRERLGAGKTIPEGITVFQYQETKISK